MSRKVFWLFLIWLVACCSGCAGTASHTRHNKQNRPVGMRERDTNYISAESKRNAQGCVMSFYDGFKFPTATYEFKGWQYDKYKRNHYLVQVQVKERHDVGWREVLFDIRLKYEKYQTLCWAIKVTPSHKLASSE